MGDDVVETPDEPISRLDATLTELGVPLDAQLAELAQTHRSWAYEHGGVPTNERLEFLGDAVLGIVVTEHLYATFPDRAEGQLAKLRAAVVNAQCLAKVAQSLDLGDGLKLGRGELTTGGRSKVSILADTMEAFIGAIHLTGGIEMSSRFVHHLFDPLIDDAARLGAGLDWKTSLQQLSAQLGLGVPSYEHCESGPDHDKRFEAYAVTGEHRFGPGSGLSKKQAEQEAAALAYASLSASAEG
ncbi:MAG TPA: ribonuclease III [Propionibacteriaceae bacterium]|nr:ribonuclease III [Propionibacteriaceae bacterium]